MTEEDSYDTEYTVEVTGDRGTQEHFQSVITNTRITGSPKIIDQTMVNEKVTRYKLALDSDEWHMRIAEENTRAHISSAPGEVEFLWDRPISE